MREITNLNDCLRYSLSQSEKISFNIRCYDSRKKYLDELVLEAYFWFNTELFTFFISISFKETGTIFNKYANTYCSSI